MNGQTVANAGAFTGTASENVYTFTVPTGGQSVNLGIAACPSVTYSDPLQWKLLNGAGASIKNGGCGNTALGTLPVDTYRLVLDANSGAGTYSLDMEAPRTFATTLPLTASGNTLNGQTVANAGAFTGTASENVYTFSVPTGGQSVNLGITACPSVTYSNPLQRKLLNGAGASVKNGGCGNTGLGTLLADNYWLVLDADGGAGTYNLTMQ